LIEIDVNEIEEEICEMIENKLLQCRIDRMSGVA
jgi:26S proteasome regulatory subunit N5